jgi:hypothetical protein
MSGISGALTRAREGAKVSVSRNSLQLPSCSQGAASPFECKVSEESRAQNRWQTDAGGILIATGCQGGLTGYGADRPIIDDPIRDRAAAESEPMRDSLWSWREGLPQRLQRFTRVAALRRSFPPF